ncbi:MAG: class I SAM-dependent methyltransferase [Gammaproteobacteria bacterium]
MSDPTYTGVENLEAMREAERYNRFLVDLVTRHREGSGPALDFGAGSGTFAALLRDRGLPVRCLEPDEHLQGLITSQGLDVVGDAAAIADGSIDYVYSLNVLEHIEDDRAALAQICRILRPGGRLLLYVPAFQILYSSMDERVGHFRRYRRRPLSDLVRETGLRVEHSVYADSVGFLAALVYRFVGDRSGTISGAQVRTYDRLIFPISRALDRLFGKAFGKNVYLVAVKDRPRASRSG